MPNISNPEAFQLEAAALLAAGYEAFPSHFGWVFDVDSEIYPTLRGQSRREIQFETIRWLISNDYLTCEVGCHGDLWDGLQLSERGLTALNSVPDVLLGKEPLGKRLVAAVAGGGIEVIKQLVPLAIQQAFGS